MLSVEYVSISMIQYQNLDALREPCMNHHDEECDAYESICFAL